MGGGCQCSRVIALASLTGLCSCVSRNAQKFPSVALNLVSDVNIETTGPTSLLVNNSYCPGECDQPIKSVLIFILLALGSFYKY